MAETVALAELITIIALIGAVWMLNDELKSMPKCSDPTHEEGYCCENGKFGDNHECRKQPGIPYMPSSGTLPTPRTITAKDIAAGNLNRQVVRKSKSWADIRARVESMSDMDPEVARSKRVEKFIGDN